LCYPHVRVVDPVLIVTSCPLSVTRQRCQNDPAMNDASDDFLKDLIECVEAARDGVPSNSIFALQCDLVLSRAHELGIVTARRQMLEPAA
jgi:hypothetical protein